MLIAAPPCVSMSHTRRTPNTPHNDPAYSQRRRSSLRLNVSQAARKLPPTVHCQCSAANYQTSSPAANQSSARKRGEEPSVRKPLGLIHLTGCKPHLRPSPSVRKPLPTAKYPPPTAVSQQHALHSQFEGFRFFEL